jgi:hypothetical protein
MLILNPIYDWSFKYLLDNNDLAKKFLSVILKREIIHLETRNTELPLLKEGNPFLSRFDFKAIIQDAVETQEVLIEIQKYKHPNPVSRFRTYLAENYMKQETYKDLYGENKTESLPIIAIYILGYCPNEFKVPYIIVKNKIYDGVDDTELDINSLTVKQLTHTVIFMITTPPAEYKWRGSRQEALLRLFRQKLPKEAPNTIYNLEEEPQDAVAREIVKYLQLGTQDEKIVKQLKAEEEYIDAIGDLETNLKQAKQREEEAKQREEEAKQREEEAKQREEEERKQKEEAQNKLFEVAKELLKSGMPIDKVHEITKISIDEIKKL